MPSSWFAAPCLRARRGRRWSRCQRRSGRSSLDRHRAASSSRWTPPAACSTPGAVAIDGARHRRRRHAGRRSPRSYRGRGDHRRRAAQVVMPGLINTHTHAPMVLYRGLADDLALMDWLQKYIFPGRSEDRVAGVRPRRHAAGGARDDRVGHDDLRRHVLLRGGDRAGRRRRRACAACSARRSSSFRSPTRRRRPKAWPAPRRSSRSSQATI